MEKIDESGAMRSVSRMPRLWRAEGGEVVSMRKAAIHSSAKAKSAGEGSGEDETKSGVGDKRKVVGDTLGTEHEDKYSEGINSSGAKEKETVVSSGDSVK